MTRHGRGRVRPRWDFQFPLLRYRGAEYCCICGAKFPSDDGLKRHLAIHRWDDPTQGETR